MRSLLKFYVKKLLYLYLIDHQKILFLAFVRVDKCGIYRVIHYPFISFARPKETKQRTCLLTAVRQERRLIQGIFSTIISKNRNQNSVSLRSYAPVLGAFEYYSQDKEFSITDKVNTILN